MHSFTAFNNEFLSCVRNYSNDSKTNQYNVTEGKCCEEEEFKRVIGERGRSVLFYLGQRSPFL